jgi:hypothetical protein
LSLLRRMRVFAMSLRALPSCEAVSPGCEASSLVEERVICRPKHQHHHQSHQQFRNHHHNLRRRRLRHHHRLLHGACTEYQALLCLESFVAALSFLSNSLLLSFFFCFFASFSACRSRASRSLFSLSNLACCGEMVSEAFLLRYLRFAEPTEVKAWRGYAEWVLADV